MVDARVLKVVRHSTARAEQELNARYIKHKQMKVAGQQPDRWNHYVGRRHYRNDQKRVLRETSRSSQELANRLRVRPQIDVRFCVLYAPRMY